MKFPVFAAFLLMSADAFAMPCDTGYLCTSSSGKYQIEIRRCRYDNRLGNIQRLKVDGKDVTDAKLGAAFTPKSQILLDRRRGPAGPPV